MRHFDTELAPSVSHQLPPLHKHCLPPPPITTSNMKAVRPLSRGDNHTATHATAAAPPLTKCATSPSQQARMPSAEEQAPCFECDFDLHPLMKTCGSVLPDQSLSCDGSDVRPAPTTTQRLLDASTPSTPCRPTWRCFSCGESFAANAAIYVSDECKAVILLSSYSCAKQNAADTTRRSVPFALAPSLRFCARIISHSASRRCTISGWPGRSCRGWTSRARPVITLPVLSTSRALRSSMPHLSRRLSQWMRTKTRLKIS
ncbi:hypothetical protein P153DRAFT_145030 [Dothidotthia symphoricarpi CBS 119687]|uniref:Uncharacterized protein n=1 Tax=Dothidotthia symphoricarpi CBS 119687 TaxID=1392245 RepID=A0A6A5ZZH9_9PLEO|nr:uncharacterized protein P153DRAFT_145030 [Dothidotthia symphoricarpi CBS 119687]KAF2123731.1 hypothetical protein P153DRAFT_145030 [Dothidotthia symphoricarpi CBS 119687]